LNFQLDPPIKIYLKKAINISDQEIKGLFISFGDVLNIQIEESKSGVIFKDAVVTFKRTSQAKVAISKLNGFFYRNQYLQVGLER
jgi:RNA recognition motif-containing protein